MGKHPTSNIQHPTSNEAHAPSVGCWMLVVGCWMLISFSRRVGEGLRLVKIKHQAVDRVVGAGQLSADAGAEGLAEGADVAVGQLRPEKSHPQFAQVAGKLPGIAALIAEHIVEKIGVA